MAAPFTQVEIQAEIDFYKEKMRVAATNQEYRYSQSTGSEVDMRRAKLEEIQSALQYWLGLMEKYFPDAFSVQPKIEFNEIGFLNG